VGQFCVISLKARFARTARQSVSHGQQRNVQCIVKPLKLFELVEGVVQLEPRTIAIW